MTRESSQTGFFVTFEGSEGCGKSTQIRRLAASLEEVGREVVLVREPGGTVIGEHIRNLLQHSRDGEGMAPETELLLFAASRAQLVREVIRPALEDGRIVISDRFFDSTTVYQGVARRLAAAEVRAINAFAVGDCVPDLTFLLDMDERAGMKRTEKREGKRFDRMECEPLEFYRAVREGYLALAESEPERFCVLDAARPEDEIAAAIIEKLQEKAYGHIEGTGI